MPEPEERTLRPDDTAAFQRFYNEDVAEGRQRGFLYRLFLGWWRDRG